MWFHLNHQCSIQVEITRAKELGTLNLAIVCGTTIIDSICSDSMDTQYMTIQKMVTYKPVDLVFEESLVLQVIQYCIHLLRKPTRTDLMLCDRWQTSAQACTCC